MEVITEGETVSLGLKDIWLKEHSKIISEREINEALNKIVETLNLLFKDEKYKIIINTRIKDTKSLDEKIKRNELDTNHENSNKSILEVLDDIIGIRIVCTRMLEEKLIYEKLLCSYDWLLEKGLNFNESINNQPQCQKNGHSIYRIKGCINEFLFELQIKSLTNLYWGEMEHLLVYKNNKYLLNSEHYKNELESIYVQLDGIDKRLSTLQEVMLREESNDLDNEKKDILSRIMYLAFKDILQSKQGNVYLNNNYIYEAVTNLYLAKETQKKAAARTAVEMYNKKLSKSFELLLSENLNGYTIDEFDMLDEIKMVTEETKWIVELMKSKNNGFYYMFIILTILNHNSDINEQNTMDKMSFQSELDRSFASIIDIVNGMLEHADEISVDNFNSELFKKMQFKLIIGKKDIFWTSKKLRKEYTANLNNVLISLENYNIFSNKLDVNEEKFINAICELLYYGMNSNENIKKYIQEINLILKENNMIEIPSELLKNNILLLEDLINTVEKGK